MTVVATLRPACDGLFGPCVAVEEGGANLAADCDMTQWAQLRLACTAAPGAGPAGGTAFDVTATGETDPFLFQSANLSDLSGRTFTFSLYVRADDPTAAANTMLYLYASPPTAEVHSVTITPTTEWQRFSITATFTGAYSQLVYRLDPPQTAPADTCIQVAMPMVEERAFATSFVDGSRAAPQLRYPAHLLNPEAGTLAAWAYLGSAAHDPALSGFSCLFRGEDAAGKNVLAFRRDSLSSVWRFVVGDATSTAYIIPPAPSAGWHLVVLTWGATGCAGYLDGSLSGTTTHQPDPSAWDPAYLYVGTHEGNQPFNSLLSNLLVLPYAVDADTVAQWHSLQQPFFDPAPVRAVPLPSAVTLAAT